MAIYHQEQAEDYTATITNVANVATSTRISTSYIKSLGFITVFGQIQVTPTAAANTTTEIGVSLPIGSSFTGISDASGAAVGDSVNQFRACHVSADAANDRISIKFSSAATTAINVSFTATYKLL